MAEIINDQLVQEWLEEVLNEQDLSDEYASPPFGIGVTKVTDFETHGMLTRDKGVVVKFADATGLVTAKYALTIQKLRE